MAELISASVKVNRVVLKELISCKIPIKIFEVWKKWWPTKRKLLKLVWEGIKVALNIFPSVFRLSLKSDCLKPLRNVLVRSFNCSAALTHTHTHTQLLKMNTTLWAQWGPKSLCPPFLWPLFLLCRKRLLPPRPSLLAKGQALLIREMRKCRDKAKAIKKQ